MVHKATHHFDLVNWWLGAQPETVHAFGSRQFYTPATARRMGLQGHHERCLTCPEKAEVQLLLRPGGRPGPEGAVPRQRKARRLFPRPVRVAPGDQHRGHDERDGPLRQRRAAELRAVGLRCLGGLPHRLQRHQGPARAPHRRIGGAAGAAKVQSGNENVSIRVIPIRGQARDIEPWTGKLAAMAAATTSCSPKSSARRRPTSSSACPTNAPARIRRWSASPPTAASRPARRCASPTWSPASRRRTARRCPTGRRRCRCRSASRAILGALRGRTHLRLPPRRR
jgi:hypothetical protein